MYYIRICVLEMLAAAVFLLPVYFLLNRFRFRNWKKTVLNCLLSFYLVAVWVLTGLPSAAYIRFEGNFNFIPFLPMLRDLKNSILNIAMFLPLGFLLPVLWKKYRRLQAVLGAGFGLSLAIEVLQIFTYRATDVNDLITNVLGTLAGFAAGKCFLGKYKAIGGDHKEYYGDLAIVFLVMFFGQCFLSRYLWDGILY